MDYLLHTTSDPFDNFLDPNVQNLFSMKFRGTVIRRVGMGAMSSETDNLSTRMNMSAVERTSVTPYEIYVLNRA